MMKDLPPFRKILSVEATQGYGLRLTWEHGRQSSVDLSDMIHRGGVFAALADKDLFAAVRVGEAGRVIEWPEPKDDYGRPVIEIDSIALAYKVGEQHDSRHVSTVRKAPDPVRRRVPRPTV